MADGRHDRTQPWTDTPRGAGAAEPSLDVFHHRLDGVEAVLVAVIALLEARDASLASRVAAGNGTLVRLDEALSAQGKMLEAVLAATQPPPVPGTREVGAGGGRDTGSTATLIAAGAHGNRPRPANPFRAGEASRADGD